MESVETVMNNSMNLFISKAANHVVQAISVKFNLTMSLAADKNLKKIADFQVNSQCLMLRACLSI